jgi:hypothetical protein
MTDTGYRFRCQTQGKGSDVRHRIQVQMSDTGYRFRCQTQGTGSDVRHRVQVQMSDTGSGKGSDQALELLRFSRYFLAAISKSLQQISISNHTQHNYTIIDI